MKRGTDRITTAHAGSLSRPQDLIASVARLRNGRFVEHRLADTCGIGIDLSKAGWKV